jgi:hypothetical protein
MRLAMIFRRCVADVRSRVKYLQSISKIQKEKGDEARPTHNHNTVGIDLGKLDAYSQMVIVPIVFDEQGEVGQCKHGTEHASLYRYLNIPG